MQIIAVVYLLNVIFWKNVPGANLMKHFKVYSFFLLNLAKKLYTAIGINCFFLFFYITKHVTTCANIFAHNCIFLLFLANTHSYIYTVRNVSI